MKHVKTYEDINEGMLDDAWSWITDNAHIMLPIAEIGAMFIPVIGPFLAMGIGLGDAALYHSEGDNTSAGISAAFSMLPGIGMIAKKIPGIKTLGKEGMESLSKKVVSKSGAPLSKTEKQVLKEISENPALIQRGLRQDMEHKAMKRFDPKCSLKAIAESEFVESYVEFINEANGACSIYTKSIMDISMKDPGLLVKYGGMLKKGSNKLNDGVDLIKSSIEKSINVRRSGGYAVNHTDNISQLLSNRSDDLIGHYQTLSKNIKGFEGSDFALSIKKQSQNLRELASKSDGYYKYLDDQVDYAKMAITQLDDTAQLYTKHYKKLNDMHIDGNRIEKAFKTKVNPAKKTTPKKTEPEELFPTTPTKTSRPVVDKVPMPVPALNPKFSKRAADNFNNIDKVMNKYFKGGYDDAVINKMSSLKKRYKKLEFDVVDGKKLSKGDIQAELKHIDDELYDIERYIEKNRHLNDFAEKKSFYDHSDELASRGDYSLRHPSGAISQLRRDINI